MSEFDDPGSSAGIKWDDLLGSLLLFNIHSLETGIQTTFGEKDAIRADVDVIDGNGAGETFNDALVFPRALQGQLRGKVGGRVLGRLAQGAAKPGQKPPWLLEAASDADKKKASAHLTAAAPPF